MEMRKIWRIGGIGDDAEALSSVSAISSALGISSACARLLYLRGYKTVESAVAAADYRIILGAHSEKLFLVSAFSGHIEKYKLIVYKFGKLIF